MPIPERYNNGYNLGVGGAVVSDGRLLLVRRASRRGHGNWQIPGGFVEVDETIETAVVREVQEEASILSEVRGILGVRNRYSTDNGNSLYVVFLMSHLSGDPSPDRREVDQAEYFGLDEILQLPQIPEINKEVAKRALDASNKLLDPMLLLHSSGAEYTMFLG